MIRLRLIGQMEAWTLKSESILPTGRKTRALLAILALSAPRPMLRGTLAEMLWSRRAEEQARGSLRQEIHRLLDALDPLGSKVLAVTRDHLSLKPGAAWLDVDEVMRASLAEPDALALLDGELLEGLDGVDPAFDGWLAGERMRLSDRARSLADLLLRDQKEPEATITAAKQMLRIDRAHEGAWRALMRAYLARGERGMAIQAFERCRSVLSELLDAQPSDETQRLLVEVRSVAKQVPAALTAMSATASTPAANVMAYAGPPAPPVRSSLEVPGRGLDDLEAGLEVQPNPRDEPARGEAPELGRTPVPRGGARVGVMPLQLVGTMEHEVHLSTGLADEITTALARFRWMSLVSSGSLARFSRQIGDEDAIRRIYGLDFLLDGVVQRAGVRLRVSLRLVHLCGGNQVMWSGRFDGMADDVLTWQDEVVAEVAAQIDQEILLIEAQRVAARPLSDPSAYDLLLRAISLLGRLERPLFMRAGGLLRQAIALEPDRAASHAWLAFWHVFLVGQAWADDPEAAIAEAGQLAERAIRLDPQDAKALTIAGHVCAFLHHRLDEAISLHERALTLNPNLAMAWNLSGVAYAYMGDVEEAERRIMRYKKLSPLDPQAFFFDTARIIVALLKRDYVSAVAIGREVTIINAAFSAALKPYVAALGYLDGRDALQGARTRLLSLEPSFTISRFLATSPLARASDREHYAEGLRLAGIPE